MFVPILAFTLALLALGLAASIVVRHWKEMRLLDPLSIQEERERQQREALMERRFERVHADKLQPLKRAARHIDRVAKAAYRHTYQRLLAFEAVYKKNIKGPFAAMAPSNRDRIKNLHQDAKAFMRDLKWADAERRYLEILALDTHQAEAYKGLGQIYLKQKLYPQAKETFDFLVKIKKTDDAVFSALAEISEAEGDLVQAEGYRLKAVEAGPRQAFRHAELAELYLRQNQAAKAWPPVKRASDLDSKSVKYAELALETAIALGQREEAQKRFDRLRLLGEDSVKFQAWREKIAAL